MTRSDLISEMVTLYPYLLPQDIEKIVLIIFDEISAALERGDRVELRGFGTFAPRERKERQGRNPRTGGAVLIAEKKVPFFKIGKDLHCRINKQDN